MKKKTILLSLIIVILTILLGLFLFNKFFSNDKLPNNVVIIQYELNGLEKKKEVVIDSKKSIEELSEHVSKLKPLSDNEMVNLALLQEIVIEYNDSISIGLQLDQEYYCYYINKEKNISTLSKMPKGLIDWVKDNL